MRTILFLLCIFLSIKFIDNSQCISGVGLAGHCGCCPFIGGSCIDFGTIDGTSVSWHMCVPSSLKKNFSLKQCKPELMRDKNNTRICRTRNGTFRLFHQCAKKEICFLSTPSRICMIDLKLYQFFFCMSTILDTPNCNTQMAVAGPCKQSIQRFSYDAKQRRCVPFMYSGCGGTTNRFYRQDKCAEQCIKRI
ncbi:unnamed protein product [Rotaria magnacalcarata]|uniref:BPTI/Kunitz inhibitor domain-containing protein n=1 Tax=Rotaria magnacalcarata TaxID=392030 RepID=A0A819GDY0_9BILA|nr:unnamed protein product [Rotaria magnacalcarata]CAF3884230.1 unnamed protein product [Rotaria magnacalcarata]CAF4873879.1 unnamed protein product [Rotaria magnacalcarata]